MAKRAVAERTTIRQTVLDLGFVDRGELTLEQLDAAPDVLAMTRPPLNPGHLCRGAAGVSQGAAPEGTAPWLVL